MLRRVDPFTPAAPHIQPAVLHADAAWLVAVKPAGLLAVPGKGEAGRHNLVSRLQNQFGNLHVVHRLDQATSGLMLLARDLPALRVLGAAFAERRVAKRYEAVVHGSVTRATGSITLALLADWPNRPRQRVDAVNGKPSHTDWQVLAPRNEASAAAGAVATTATTRLALWPRTGRSHQLRVHLHTIGHGIVGDALYGGAADAAMPRLLLHATSLTLAHPRSGQLHHFHHPAPF